jgi:hypothetical protein
LTKQKFQNQVIWDRGCPSNLDILRTLHSNLTMIDHKQVI